MKIKQIFIKLIITVLFCITSIQLSAQCWYEKLSEDLASSTVKADFVDFIKNNDDSFEVYELIFKARGANSLYKTDALLLQKVQTLIQDATFLERIGNTSGLERIIKANKRAGCVSCGNSGATYLKNIDKYLDDVKNLAENYHNVPGFTDVLNDLKRINTSGSPNLNVEGSAYMLRVLNENGSVFLNKVLRFEGSIDDLANGCKYDFIFNNSQTIKFAEFKSYISTSVSSIFSSGSSKYKQFSTYFGKIKSIDELKYFFDANKISDISNIKTAFIDGIKNNKIDLFSKMTDDLKASLQITDISEFTDAKIIEIVETIIQLN